MAGREYWRPHLKSQGKSLKDKCPPVDSTLHRAKRLLIYLVAAFGYKRPVFNLARKAAIKAGKPLLNAGCCSNFTDQSDVNLVIVPKEVARFVNGDIQKLSQFKDKQFGAVYASHVLEHVEDVDSALKEFRRVAENVYVITPFPLWPSAWLSSSHKWILWRGKRIARTPYYYAKQIAYNVKRLLAQFNKNTPQVERDGCRWGINLGYEK